MTLRAWSIVLLLYATFPFYARAVGEVLFAGLLVRTTWNIPVTTPWNTVYSSLGMIVLLTVSTTAVVIWIFTVTKQRG